MNIILSQSTYFFQAVEPQLNLIWRKTLLYHCKDQEKPKVILFGSTEISAINIGGTTIHSGLASSLKQIYLFQIINIKLL